MRVNLILDYESKIMGIISDPLSEALPIVEIEALSEINVGFDKFINGKIVKQEVPVSVTNTARILQLKEMLAKTDYLAIKHADGDLTDEEYAETKAQRHAWRQEINELEN